MVALLNALLIYSEKLSLSQASNLSILQRCEVTNATDTVAADIGHDPVWCEDDTSACVSGLKQMLC
ncbi:hypothetical protein FISHEDRAFT_47974 [Fistulina hepatica ATCC 64428]|uniref:Uncharacterized protein n=1 Tax=Fistulina hepatica ATCC 64428 TaxID=1128425 RepID=A0A0D7A4V8_9AGAR|nr:hypothetical protein FISHEDRAFT_47884 [Fistulina hepatica ATCC 64428]KIY46057.1 hypothetical protein FISHEDRAFT_47974 [Fistulina hepatica ATCC 64428]